MATGIFQRKDRKNNNWYVRFKHNGKVHKYEVGPDKAAAVAVARKIDQERAFAKAAGKEWTGLAKIQEDNSPKTFRQAADDYMQGMTDPKEATVATYTSQLKVYLLPEFGDVPLRDIKPIQIRKFQARIVQEKSSTYVRSILSLFTSILNQAVIDEQIDKNPCNAVKKVPDDRTEVDPLTEAELEIVLAAIPAHHRPLFACLAYTGARPNELMALRWSDVDWHRMELKISKGRVRGKEAAPKTPAGNRCIPITKPVEDALYELKSRTVVSAEGYVFTTKKGEPYTKHLDRIWKRALSKTGLRHRPSYQLRHTYATLAIEKGIPLGVSLMDIARHLGHSSIGPVMNNYAKWIDSSTKETSVTMRNMFGEVSPKVSPVTQERKLHS